MNKYLLIQFMAWELLAEMVYWSKESRQMKPKKTELISGSGPLRSDIITCSNQCPLVKIHEKSSTSLTCRLLCRLCQWTVLR